jgi:ABC-2 type transport system permease protein
MTQATMQAPQATTGPALPPWNSFHQGINATLLLAGREIKTVWRMPAMLIPNMLIPIFFYFVMVGSLEEFAAGFGETNWKGFQLPVSIMFAVQSGSAGLNMVADIESGYFDKLLLTPASRLSILVGAMSADFLRIMVQASIVVALGVATGVDIATGPAGVAVIILLSSLWGPAFSAIGFAIALRTGNSQATQSIWTLFIPLMFLTTAFAPMEALSGWLKVAASLNPMTYLLNGMRALTMEGWDMTDLGIALAAVAILATLTFTMALMALRSRLR